MSLANEVSLKNLELRQFHFQPGFFQNVLLYLVLGFTILIQVQAATLTSLEKMTSLYLLCLVSFALSWGIERVKPFLSQSASGAFAVLFSLTSSIFIYLTQDFSPFFVLVILLNILYSGVTQGFFGGLFVSLVSTTGFLLVLLLNPQMGGVQIGLVSTLNSATFLLVGFVSGFFHETLFETRAELEETKTEKEKLEWDLKQKEKLAAIGQLAAGLAHEIRNPLASISGSIEMLSQTTSSLDDQKLMRIVLKEVHRLNQLITEFLDYAKPGKLPTDVVALDQIIQESLDGLQMSLRSQEFLTENLKLEVALDNAWVKGFSGPLKQAFLNFFINAVQAMKDSPSPCLRVQLKSGPTKVQVSIEDNGSGMPLDVQQRIFEPFFTTRAKGTGLGLAMTHKILTMHSVQISLESKVGVGTRFILEFPPVNLNL